MSRCPGVRRQVEPHPWQVAGWGHLHKPINAQVHPHAIERVLDNVDDARLPGSRRAIQDDDLSWCTGLCQAVFSLADVETAARLAETRCRMTAR